MEANNGLEAIRGNVEVEVGGKVRRLVLDFNALAELERVTGRRMLDGEGWEGWRKDERPDAVTLRAFLWAAMLADSPGITLEEVGGMLRARDTKRLIPAIAKAIVASMKSADATESEDDEEGGTDDDADPRSGRPSDVMTSGRSPASDLA